MLPSPTLAVPMTSEAAGRGDHVHHVSACCLLFGDAACVPARFGCEKQRHGRLNLIASLSDFGGGCGFLMAALQEYGSARPRSVGSVRFLRMAGEFVTAGDGTLRGTWRGSARGERGRARGSRSGTKRSTEFCEAICMVSAKVDVRDVGVGQH